jgi:hypothetical protein
VDPEARGAALIAAQALRTGNAGGCTVAKRHGCQTLSFHAAVHHVDAGLRRGCCGESEADSPARLRSMDRPSLLRHWLTASANF